MPPAFPSSARILVVDDQEDILLAARLLLKRHFRSVETLRDPSRLPDLTRASAFDVLLLDMNFALGAEDGAEGLSWLVEGARRSIRRPSSCSSPRIATWSWR